MKTTLRVIVLLLFCILSASAALLAQQPCAANATTTCLLDGRFQVQIAWQDFTGATGVATLAPAGTDDSQVLWFFDPTNWEMLVKMVDGCAFNSRFWVFSAATTNVAYTIQITDTFTGATQTYRNQLGTSAPAITDTAAFAGCSASRPAAMPAPLPPASRSAAAAATTAAPRTAQRLLPFVDQASCLADATHACLGGTRFKAEIAWQDGSGNQGAGQVAPFGSDDSGLFWFFDPTNWEMLVKVLDACALNNHFWVFSAATTNVQYTLKVTDTFTGAVQQYANPAGRSAPAVTDTAAFATCGVAGPPQVEFTSDRSVSLRQVGDQAHLAVQVVDGNGQPIPGATVTFTAADPALVSVTKDGAQSAVVTALAPPPGSTTVTASYGTASADALVLLAVPASGTVLITSDLVTAKDTGTLTLKPTAATLALVPGQILVSGDRAGVLDKLTSVTVTATGVQCQTTPVSLADAFSVLTAGESGRRMILHAAIARGPAGFTQTTSLNGRVAATKPLDGFGCTLHGTATPGIQLTNPSISVDAELTPKAFLDLSHGVQDFRVLAEGTVTASIDTGGVELGAQLGGTVTCSSTLDSIEPVHFPFEGFDFALELTPTIGVDLAASFSGPSLSLKGPSGTVTGTVTAGIEYQPSTGWQTIHQGGLNGQLSLFDFSSNSGGWNASIKPFVDIDVGLQVALGIDFLPFVHPIPLADLDFLAIEATAPLTFSLPSPINPANPAYVGPTWGLDLELTAGLTAELSGGKLADLLHRVGVDTSFTASLGLFDVTLPLAGSPSFQIGATPKQVDAAQQGAVSFSATSNQTPSGSVSFVAGNPAATLAQGAMSSGSAAASWTPSAAQQGTHLVRGLFAVDPVSRVFPYVSTNSVSVTVTDSGSTPPPAGPAPAIASVSPNPVPGSAGAQPFTVSGSNFVTGANVILRDLTAGQPYPNRMATSFSSTRIVLDPIFGTAADSWSVEVINPDGQTTGQYPFQVTAGQTGPGNPAPSIASVSPNPVPGSNNNQPFTLFGANFVSGANIVLRDLTAGQTFANQVPTSFSSSQIVLDPDFTTAGDNWSVEVINPDGQTTGQFAFKVTAGQTGPGSPSISSVSPNPVPGSNNNQPFTIFGANFVSGANIVLRDLTAGQTFANRTPTSFSSSQIVLDPDFTTAGDNWSVEVINPDGQTTGQFDFRVTAGGNPAPSIGSVSPNPVPGSNNNQQFTIFGSNFASGANITLRDLTAGQTFANRSPTSFSSSQIVLDPDFTTAGDNWSVEVINPDGQTTGQFDFRVTAGGNPAPSIGSVSPNPVPGSNNNQQFTIFGSNFASGANITLRDLTAGQTFANRSPTSFSSSQIVLDPDFTTAGDNWSVEVINPDGQTTGQFDFRVTAGGNPAPSIGSVSPNPVPGSNNNQQFTIFGSNFTSGANIILRDLTAGQTFANRSPTSFSSSQIVLDPDFTTAGDNWSVEVINPDGQTTGQFDFRVTAGGNPAPSIGSVSPNPVPGSNNNQQFTIFGSNFTSGANVILRDLTAGQTFANRSPTSFSSSQIVLDPDFTTAGDNWSVEVINPDGQTTGQFDFRVTAASNPAPTIGSVSPSPVTGSNSNQLFTIFGANFVSGANIILRDVTAGETFANRVPTSFSSSQIVLDPDFTTAAHLWSVEVVNPNGQTTGQYYFDVT